MSNEKLLMCGSFLVILVILLGLFVLEFYTENDIFNETINGMIIGGSFTWIGAYITFYTTNGKNHEKDDSG